MPGTEILGEDIEGLSKDAVLSRGLGRSYGDSSLPAVATDRVIATRLANRLLRFDESSGSLTTEAGVALYDLNRIFIPRGWFVPVTPGTKFVTVGGMVASDVHGKNHHREGCFGAHVTALRMRLSDGSLIDASPSANADLFYATIGGMGLLGHILEVTFTMKRIASPWIWQESERVPSIEAYLDALEVGAKQFPMTSGWIDCLHKGRSMGRGILFAARWAEPGEAPSSVPSEKKPITFPFMLPNWALNDFTASVFNQLVYTKHMRGVTKGIVHPDACFYPLDAILEWNRGYGRRGFTQYQCVLPREAGKPAVVAFMKELTALGGASPLCVIKDCGPEGKGLLSFPLEGTSIAIDMAVSPDAQRIVDRLNEFVIAAGGRIYLTKDRFTRREHFSAMEKRLPAFMAAREKWDPQHRLRSAQSVRVFGDKA